MWAWLRRLFVGETRTLVLARCERQDLRQAIDTPEFQARVQDWLNGKVAALVMPLGAEIHVVTVPK